MHDILPQEQGYWDMVESVVKSTAAKFGFRRIRMPVLERTELFIRGVGRQSDVVKKEMYSFKTKGGDELTLRPEGTAPVMRAYLENGMKTWVQPVKLYYFDPFFRHEQPQHARYRQFYQIGFESIGMGGSAVDVELILAAHYILGQLGLDGYEFQVNTLGDTLCQQPYLASVREYFKSNKKSLCAECAERSVKHPLNVFDCKEVKCQKIARTAPKMIDALCENCRDNFKEVLELLDELEIPYALNPFVVRGLEYYTRTVFEIWISREGKLDARSAVGGGGRYDKLSKQLGGEEIPGSGFGLGVERILEVLKERGIKKAPFSQKANVFIAQLGFQAKKRSLRLFLEFLNQGIMVQASFARDSLSSQLRVADKVGVDYAVILGEKELSDKSVILRDMKTGNQETLEMKDLIAELKNRLNIL